MASIKSRLDGLTGLCIDGAIMGYEFPLDAFGKKVPYRDFEPGGVTPAGRGRMLAAGEQGQPHIWAFQVHHIAPTRAQVLALCIETDMSLIGWEPSGNSSPINLFFFHSYDQVNVSGERIAFVASRFYETELGQNPDMTL